MRPIVAVVVASILGCGRLADDSADEPADSSAWPRESGAFDSAAEESAIDVGVTDTSSPTVPPDWPDGGEHADALWARQTHAIDKGRFYAWSLAVGGDGRVAIGGIVGRGVDLGGGLDPCMGCLAIVVRNPDASLAWQRTYHAGAEPFVMSFASDGALFVGGEVAHSGDFGGGPRGSGSYYDSFLLKVDAAGNHLWSRQFALYTPIPTDGGISGILVGPSDEITVVGWFTGRADFGTGAVTTSADHGRMFVARVSALTGDTTALRIFPEASTIHPYRTARCPSGNIASSGQFIGKVDFGTVTLPARTQESGYVAVLDPAGNALSAVIVGDPGEPAGSAVSIPWGVTCIADATGKDLILVGGGGKGTLRFGDHVRSTTDFEGFVAAYGADGTFRWLLDGAGTVGVSVDSITAHGASASAFVGGAGWIGVIEIAADGSVSWGRKIADAGGWPCDLLRAPSDHLLLGKLDFGVDPLETASDPDTLDGFIAKLAP